MKMSASTAKTRTAPNALVLGMGNLIMSDDGVGIRVVQDLQREYRFPRTVEVVDGGTLGLDLLPLLEGRSHLILVDALETGKRPGTCIRLSGEELPVALETKLSPHQMGLKDLLAVSRLTGHSPAQMVLIGVQPRSIEMDEHLSPEVELQVETMKGAVLKELALIGINARAVAHNVDECRD